MTNYRRLWVPGAHWFVTVALADRNSSLLVDRVADLRAAFARVQRAHSMKIEAICILPSHLHLVLALPEADGDLGTRVGLVKSAFSRSFAPLEPCSRSRRRRGERGVWQRRFWEHWIRGERDLTNHLDYVHFNPVKHGLVRRAIDWPCSSLHRYVARGYLPLDWKCDETIDVAGDE